MAETENLGIPLPDPASEVDDEFFRLQQAWILVDAVIWALTQAVAQKANVSHTQAMSTVTGLVEALAAKMPADRTFSLDDLTDVNGAAGAAINYVLVKNASGQWVPSSAAAALGSHQHSTSDILGLTAVVNAAVSAVVGGAPEMLNAIDELAAAIDNNPNFAATIMTLLGQKAASADVYTKAQVDAAIGGIQGVPTGTIIQAAFATPPTGYLKCNGAAISRTTYAALFQALVTAAGYTQQTFTVSIASPGLFSKAAHGFVGGERLRLSTNGALPTGLNTTTDYFVIYVDANTYRLSASQTSPVAINTSGTQSGTHTYLRSNWGLGDGTTFNVPDLRGVPVRGLDDGRGIDTGRPLGSFQADQNLAHNHTISDPGHAHSGIQFAGNSGPTVGSGGGPFYVSGTSASGTGITIQNSGGTEARMKNVALPFFIKF
ncbi:tail fiber protein [Neorhizobium galegae]|uniref:Tail fiber protein n=1 Tax=Neorhizobium galegae TaxID=399 RepID=A0A6A1TTJ6_NEOGA|nr:phage tail protein [Neorhizobium galegae]KAB1087355.1 tail fiber protein [Neorhizobium galegae]